MMIMTIWWSKATQLLEFSRSRSQAEPDLRTRLFCDRGGQRTEELGILVVGCELDILICRRVINLAISCTITSLVILPAALLLGCVGVLYRQVVTLVPFLQEPWMGLRILST